MPNKTIIDLGAKISIDGQSLDQTAKKINKRLSEAVRLGVDLNDSELKKSIIGLQQEFKKLSQNSGSFIQQIGSMSAASDMFGKKLGSTFASAVNDMAAKAKKLDELQSKMAESSDELKKAVKAGNVDDVIKFRDSMISTAKSMDTLNNKIDMSIRERSKEVILSERLTRIQKKYVNVVEEASRKMPDLKEGMKNSFKSLSKGDFKSVFASAASGIKDTMEQRHADAIKAAVIKKHGSIESAAGQAAMAEGGQAMSGGVAVGGLLAAGAVAGFAAFVKLIMAASDHMTTLNKALLANNGFVNDMGAGAQAYGNTIDDIRKSSMDMHGDLLKYGKNSEDAMKITSAYAKESTGSIIRTQDAFKSMGDTFSGTWQKGQEQFVISAITYGKALNMEAEEVGGFMGKLQNEVGYASTSIQGAMNDIVSKAATANMPLTKFMDIFHMVTPEINLFSNRLEHLTGVIKMLSKNMDPNSVKAFMNEFAKGFKGTSLQERIKTYYTAGPKLVEGAMNNQFKRNTTSMKAEFNAMAGGLGNEFEAASNKGEQATSDFLASLGERGFEVTPTLRNTAMQAAFGKAEMAIGGPLHTSTAMKQADILTTMAIAKGQSSFGGTKLGSGLNEKVMESLNWSQAKIDLMKKLDQASMITRSELRRNGQTTSKSVNKELIKLLAVNKKGISDEEKEAQVTKDDMMKATDEQITLANSASQDQEEYANSAEAMAEKQANATMSLSDKVGNILGWLKESLFKIFQPVLDAIDKVYFWLVGGKDDKKHAAVRVAEDYKKNYMADKSEKAGILKKEVENKEKELRKNIEEAKPGADRDKAKKALEDYQKGEGKNKLEEVSKRASKQAAMSDVMGKYEEVASQGGDVQGFLKSIGLSDRTDMAKALGVKSVEERIQEAAKFGGGTEGSGNASLSDKQQSTEEQTDFEAALQDPQKIAAAIQNAIESGTITGVHGGTAAGMIGMGETKLVSTDAKKASDFAGGTFKGPPVSTANTEPNVTVGAGRNQVPVAIPGVAATGIPGVPSVPGATPAGTPSSISPQKLGKAQLAIANEAKLTAEQTKDAASILESINTQVMGICMHVGDMHTKGIIGANGFMDGWKQTYKDVLGESLMDFMIANYRMNSKDSGDDKWRKAILSGYTAGNLSGPISNYSDKNADEINKIATGNAANKNAPKDFGGTIDTTGYYRLQRGEEVVGRADKGLGGGVINAVFNITEANNAKETAAAVRTEMNRLANRH